MARFKKQFLLMLKMFIVPEYPAPMVSRTLGISGPQPDPIHWIIRSSLLAPTIPSFLLSRITLQSSHGFKLITYILEE